MTEAQEKQFIAAMPSAFKSDAKRRDAIVRMLAKHKAYQGEYWWRCAMFYLPCGRKPEVLWGCD